MYFPISGVSKPGLPKRFVGCACATPHVTASARQAKEIFISLICFIGFDFSGWESFGVIKLE
jgi:hypothetical protein